MTALSGPLCAAPHLGVRAERHAVTFDSLNEGIKHQAKRAGLSAQERASLQKQVDQVLAHYPKGKQVSANKVQLNGGSVTLRAPGQKVAHNLADGFKAKSAYTCNYGHLCMTVHGHIKDFWKCQTWKLYNWTGDGVFVNNQTPGTVARFYNQDGSQRWSSTAYERGTATWDPIWKIKVC